MATHSSILTWRIPWMEEPGGLQSTGSQRVGHNWAISLHFKAKEKALAWRRQYYPLQYSYLENPMDRGAWRAIVHGGHRVRHDWATKHIHTQFIQIFFRMFFKSAKPFNMFGFPGCCNKLPQTRWPDISEIYSLMVVVARCPKSRAMLLPEALEENIPLSLPALGGYWHSWVMGTSLCLLCLHITFCSMYLISLCLSLVRTLLL